jgi:predicted homoserine dehydrogenase-like protein
MGDGPLYVFYIPYHLPHLESPLTVARAVLFNDAATSPIGGPVVDVITVAKQDLKKGVSLDGIGGFHTYGDTENHSVSAAANFLPMSLSEDCVLKRDIRKDQALTYEDVILPEGRVIDRLKDEQDKLFAAS